MDAFPAYSYLATRDELEQGEIYHRKPCWQNAADKFNDQFYNSGGLLPNTRDLPIFRGIDTESVNDSCDITAKKCYETFNGIKRDYAEALKKFSVSGQNNSADFINFCGSRYEAYYLKCWLESSKSVEFEAFCQEGSSFKGGFDSINGFDSTSNANDDEFNLCVVDLQQTRSDTPITPATKQLKLTPTQKQSKIVEDQLSVMKEMTSLSQVNSAKQAKVFEDLSSYMHINSAKRTKRKSKYYS